MLILPDKNISKTKFLIPVPTNTWREPSISMRKDELGNSDRTFFTITAKTYNDLVVWKGIFQDRNDFDAFLWSLLNNRLQYERELWRYSTPNWPGPILGSDLKYSLYTVNIYTSSAGSPTPESRPLDWNDTDNFFEVIGAGGSGGNGEYRNGGAGAAYSRTNNLTLSSTWWRLVGAGKSGGSGDSVDHPGTTGDDSWVNISANSAPAGTSTGCLAKGGEGGLSSNVTRASGGLASASVGNVKYDGGDGGLNTGAGIGGCGAGGSAGGTGAGNSGSDPASSNGANGGSGDAGAGGAGGTGSSSSASPGGDGSAGTEWTSAGSGGGGGGGKSNFASQGSAGGSGGNYGAGGGGGGLSSVAPTRQQGGNSTQGTIVMSYTPLSFIGFIMPHMGM